MENHSNLHLARNREIGKLPPWSQIIRGTLKRYRLTCGKPACRCHASKRFRHGPYWYVAVSHEGKKKLALIPAKQAARIRRGIEAYHKLWKGLCRISEINLKEAKEGQGVQ